MEGYIPKEQRKKILLLSDDIRFHSGIATMAREIVIGTAHKYNWINLGAAASNHPDTGKLLDLSNEVNKETGITDADVKVLANTGYGDHDLLMNLMNVFKPDAIFIFTDPRYWIWLFQMENEVRKKIPIIYLNIWDDLPAPMYNKSFYDSCDALLCISKQTENIVNMVLGDKKVGKIIEYVPHGINEKHFYPIDSNNITEYNKLLEFKNKLFGGKSYDFVAFFNSRNITRKALPTLILGFQEFVKTLTVEEAKKAILVLHTDIVDGAGTDLAALIDATVDQELVNILISNSKVPPSDLNYLYNIADVTCLPSSNEGWGLSLTESLMAGTMIIANVTGGMQDQMRFEDENGDWIKFDSNFCSNHFGTYDKCGDWAYPVFPSNLSLVGSPVTPYIFDDRCHFMDIKTALLDVYAIGKEKRDANGLKGREWIMSEEAGMTAKHMNERIIKNIDWLFNTWKPRKRFELVKAEILPPLKSPHPIVY